jgi:hypothetical protein
VADIVILEPQYRAPFLRDPNDADVLQTAERGEADIRFPFLFDQTNIFRGTCSGGRSLKFSSLSSPNPSSGGIAPDSASTGVADLVLITHS